MYDKFSSLYDKFVNWQNRLAYEMPMIESQLQLLGKKNEIRILDTACGTGMHAIELARRGYQVSGADISIPMIEKAKENARSNLINVDFKPIGFGSLHEAFIAGENEQNFDALLVLGNSIPHILERNTLDIALRDMRACLTPGGFLLIQNRNFDAVLEQHQRWMEPQSFKDVDEEYVFLRFYDFEPDGKINFNIITLQWTKTAGWNQNIESTQLFPWQSGELFQALYAAGFSSIEAFGDMEGKPFQPFTSGNLILRANA